MLQILAYFIFACSAFTKLYSKTQLKWTYLKQMHAYSGVSVVPLIIINLLNITYGITFIVNQNHSSLVLRYSHVLLYTKMFCLSKIKKKYWKHIFLITRRQKFNTMYFNQLMKHPFQIHVYTTLI